MGAWHVGEQPDPDRQVGGLHPHDLRHAFGLRRAEERPRTRTSWSAASGHRSQRYIARYPRSTWPQATPKTCKSIGYRLPLPLVTRSLPTPS